MTSNSIFEIRDAKLEDKNFIMATFLRGLYYGDSWFSLIPKNIFMDNYKILLERILANPLNVVKVACLKEDPDIILGYSILSANYQVIHYVFVKSPWRKQGIGRALTPRYPVAVTHLTTLGKSLLTKYENCVFNPFL